MKTNYKIKSSNKEKLSGVQTNSHTKEKTFHDKEKRKENKSLGG